MDNLESKQLKLALVNGEEVFEAPSDLFIPPDALEVFLEAFEGPLDFLLYIIRKQKFDIRDLPIKEITVQYTDYVKAMLSLNLELAADYLVMAATLAEIKSRMLLPVIQDAAEEEEDPRQALINRLLEYEKYKIAAEEIDKLPRVGRDSHRVKAHLNPECKAVEKLPEVSLKDLTFALHRALNKADNFQHHHITKEVLSTRARMNSIIEAINKTEEYIPFEGLLQKGEGKQGILVTFLAILELCKEKILLLTQSGEFQPIYVKRSTMDIDMGRVLQ